MANGMTNRQAFSRLPPRLADDEDFLNQAVERPYTGGLGGSMMILPTLRRVFGGGLLSGPARSLRTTGGGRSTIPGSATTVPGSSRALPTPRGGRLGALLTLLTMGGYGAYNLLNNGEEEPPVESTNVPPVDPDQPGPATGSVVTPPGDPWEVPSGLQTGLDYITNKRKFYVDSMSGALNKAAILNLMEKGAGDAFLKDIEGDIEQQEEYKNDEYVAKINKAVFGEPYKNAKQVFDRLVKAEIPTHIASQITGHIPKTKQATFINPVTQETYSAPEDSIPEPGFRRVDPTIDKLSKDRTYETSEALEEAIRIGGLQGAEYLARYIYLKGGRY